MTRHEQTDVEDAHANCCQEIEKLREDVDIEVVVVVYADAVVHPLAMMVHSFNTLIANVAVFRISSAYDLAGWTQHVMIKLLHES